MCGIVGIIGQAPVSERLLEALKRLEYRGYDSAGIATVGGDGALTRRRAEGKLGNLSARLEAEPLAGNIGIGHTRWATHGGPTETNAHPHMTSRVAVVQNGIIENFKALREELAADGYEPQSETDTEVVPLLVTRELARGATPQKAVETVLAKLNGAFALALIFSGEQSLMIAACRGAPIAVGHGDTETYLGSDAMALAPFTNRVTFLEDGDWAVLEGSKISLFDRANQPVKRAVITTQASGLLADKGNHRHFMLKEIHEQPETVGHTLAHYVDLASETVRLRETLPIDFADMPRLTISACGTAYYAGLVAKYWFERYARLPVDVDVASEFRYREPPMEKGGMALFISQSGETADTLAALRYCAGAGQHIASLLNVTESTIGRESDVVFPTLCGAEIGVASTKAFTSQLTALAALAVAAGKARGTISAGEEAELVRALAGLPGLMHDALRAEKQTEDIARQMARASDVLYLGRGQMFPLALEGALKLKEISYIHAEGYAAGELKHGPIALIEEDLPVIVVAPSDDLMEKTLSNMQEVAARGGSIVLITDEEGANQAGDSAAEVITVPTVHNMLAPIVCALPVQLLAYHTAVHMGTDVDQPRNLAKSVTVE